MLQDMKIANAVCPNSLPFKRTEEIFAEAIAKFGDQIDYTEAVKILEQEYECEIKDDE